MSMQSWTVTGYGVKEEEFDNVSTDTKVSFIKKFLPKTYEELQTEVESENNEGNFDMTNTSEYLDYCKVWIDGYEDEYCSMGFAALFAMAINENEKDFYVEYCSGEYSEENSIIYTDRLPWEMSDRVKAMTCEDMTEVFMKYLRELGINNDVCDRQSVEYYG